MNTEAAVPVTSRCQELVVRTEHKQMIVDINIWSKRSTQVQPLGAINEVVRIKLECEWRLVLASWERQPTMDVEQSRACDSHLILGLESNNIILPVLGSKVTYHLFWVPTDK